MASAGTIRGRLMAASLAVTVVVGTTLRWTLAGVPWPAWLGSWEHVRSAHSHLGYYGVLFPLAWGAWSGMGLPVPGRALSVAYAAAVLGSFLGFAAQGYALTSIVGSTVVLGVWIVSTLPLARLALQRDWLAPVAPSVWLASVAIPGVAVLSSRDHPLATPLVRGFLTWLLLGVVVATALRRLAVPPPPPWVHLPLVVGAGLALGPLPHALTWALLGGYALLLLWATLRMEAAAWLRAEWAVLALGLLVVAVGRLGHLHLVAIAGLHFAVLGPALSSLAWPRAWAWALPAYAALTCLLSVAILGPLLGPWSGWTTLGAGAGTAIAGVWLVRLSRGLRLARPDAAEAIR